MKKKSMRILSLIVAIIMVVSIIPLAAFADETKKRDVGVVVYGSELTAVLTDVESAIQGKGDLKASIETLTSIATKVADGTGISVPDVDVALTAPNGHVYKMEEKTSIDIFTDTADLYIGYQEVLDGQLTKLENDISDLKAAMKQDGGLVGEIAEQITKLEDAIAKVKDQLKNLKDTLVTGFNDLSGINGILYRTYVAEDVPVEAGYTVTIKGFSDEDENGNAITRDGYILYNDGLGEEGSKYNSARTFTVDVEEKGRFEQDIQFVGPGIGKGFGIEGSIALPDLFNNTYDSFVGKFNEFKGKLESIRDKATGSNLGNIFTSITGEIFNIENTLTWFNSWTADDLKYSYEIPKTYHFYFPGLYCAEVDAGFTFRNVDVAEGAIEGSDFLLINRQELLDVLKLMKDLGKDAFEGALKATFGGQMTYADGTVKDYESIVSLYFELLNMDEEGQISLDYETAYAIVKTYLGVIMDMHLLNRVVDFPEGFELPKLKYPIPAILKATSDENGLVTFKKSSNMTLTWIIELIPEITRIAGQLVAQGEENKMVDLMNELQAFIQRIVEGTADVAANAVNILVYPFAQRLNLVGPKLASGEYIMFQTKAPDEYWVNPIAYTMDITWHSAGTANEDWYYSTVANMGLVGPYFAEGFYDFVRQTTFAGTLDSILGRIRNEDGYNVVSDILNGKIDVTKEAMGALTAFATQVGFDTLGGNALFATRTELLADLNDYLLKTGKTAQNLVVYMNRMAMRSKTVYTGKVDDGWYFYNLNKSPTLTATKLIQKSTSDIAKAMEIESQKNIVQKTGDTVYKLVDRVGSGIETAITNIRQSINQAIGNTIKNAINNIIQSAKNSFVNFFKGLFA